MKTQDPKQILASWISALNRADPVTAANLYASESVLLPTFSPRFLHTPQERLEYFAALTARQGLEVYLHEKTVVALPLTASLHAIHGIYRFNFEIDQEPLSFEARFSMLLDALEQSPIISHHSSQIPRAFN